MDSDPRVPVTELPALQGACVTLIQFGLTVPAEVLIGLQNLLDSDELSRAFRFKRSIHQSRFIVGRARLRMILANYLDCGPKEVLFDYGPHGKPECAVAAAQCIAFNISHTGDYAVCAIRVGSEVGVDIEACKPREVSALAARYFHESESASMEACADETERLALFYHYWTAKEALLKGAGGGLTLPLNQCRFDLRQEPPALELINLPALTDQGWGVHHFFVAPDVIGAVAVAGRIEQVNSSLWEP